MSDESMPGPDNVLRRKTHQFVVSAKDISLEERDEYTFATVPIQSLDEDRDGDVVTEAGQKDMIKQLKSGRVGAFPNHGNSGNGVWYDYRTMMGQWVDGELRDDGVTMGTLRLRNNNSDADELKDLLEQEMPVGFSIGFIITSYEDQEENDGIMINAMDLLECSPVGIPSNANAFNGRGLDASDRVAIAAKGAVSQGFNAKSFAQAIQKALEDIPEFNKSHLPMTDEQKEQEGTPAPQEDPSEKAEDGEEESEQDDSKQNPEENAEQLEALQAKIEEMQAGMSALEERVSALEESGDDSEGEEEDNEEASEDGESDEDKGLSEAEKSNPAREPKKLKTAEQEGDESEKDYAKLESPGKAFSTTY